LIESDRWSPSSVVQHGVLARKMALSMPNRVLRPLAVKRAANMLNRSGKPGLRCQLNLTRRTSIAVSALLVLHCLGFTGPSLEVEHTWVELLAQSGRRRPMCADPCSGRRSCAASLVALLGTTTSAPRAVDAMEERRTPPAAGSPAAQPRDWLKLAPYQAEVRKLVSVARESGELVNFMSTQGRGGALSGGSVDALRERMEEAKRKVLLPMLQVMDEAAPRVALALADTEQKGKAEKLQAQLRAQLAEFDTDVAKGLMAEYSEGGRVYSCGLVERELELIGNTLEDFVTLAGLVRSPAFAG